MGGEESVFSRAKHGGLLAEQGRQGQPVIFDRFFIPESLGGSTARMILPVEDPDAVFQRAVAAGAVVVCPVSDQRYGWRVGRVVDPFGHHWEIGKPLNSKE